MATEEFKRALEERGWSTFRSPGQVLFSKGDNRITLKQSQDIPGKILMIKGILNLGPPKYEFFPDAEAAYRDVERFIRQESTPKTQPKEIPGYATPKRGISYIELLEEAVRNSPIDISNRVESMRELENIVNYVYMTYPGAHNITWNGHTLRFEGSGMIPTVQDRALLELEGVI